jgi:hypothetical protein
MSSGSSALAKIGVVILAGGAVIGVLQLRHKDPPKPATPTATTVTTAQVDAPQTAKPIEPARPTVNPNDPAFVDAAVAGDLAKVKALHAKGVSLEGTLAVASRSGNLELVTWLLDNGVDVHENEGSSMPPLIEADAHPDVVKLLLARGALEPSLADAVQASATATVTRLIAKGADPTARTNGSTPLIDAIGLAAGDDAPAKHLATLKALLGKGAHVDADTLATAVDVPAKRREPILALVLAAPLEKGATASAIDHVASQGDTAMIRHLATKGVAWSEITKDGGSPPIVSAAYRLDLDVVKALLDAGEPADQADENGKTAIVAAMQPTINTGEERIEDMVKLLLAHGASPNRGAGPGMKPLDVAEDAAYADVAKLLVAHGAKRARTGP